MKTRLFPEGFSMPIVAGENIVLEDCLRNSSCKWIFDDCIIVIVKDKVSDNLIDFWNVRGSISQIKFFINRGKIFIILIIISVNILIRVLKSITINPMTFYATQLTKQLINKNFYSEVIILSFCWFLKQSAFSFGEFKCSFNLIRKK